MVGYVGAAGADQSLGRTESEWIAASHVVSLLYEFSLQMPDSLTQKQRKLDFYGGEHRSSQLLHHVQQPVGQDVQPMQKQLLLFARMPEERLGKPQTSLQSILDSAPSTISSSQTSHPFPGELEQAFTRLGSLQADGE